MGVEQTKIGEGEKVNPNKVITKDQEGDDPLSKTAIVKQVCEIGGISFKSREEVAVLETIAGTKTPKKVNGCTPAKKQKQTRITQSVGGRNLSSKLLRLGSKPKLR
ncbi:hypothetical protein PIB30_016233 [Stylosanthes scabra]|uniref:Uncharacterized protein n=1 Tax=Stylosanthes scabra TaxID=79078 RepID=A0ABU6X6I6_9FABA|nr:hypothetical protein [Stylosanthes scabra]